MPRTTLDVIFRVERDWDHASPDMRRDIVTAVFPSEPGTLDPGSVLCYAHIGQHSPCSRDWYRTTRPATPEEYASLLNELCDIYGRDHVGQPPIVLRVVKRWTARHDRMRQEALQR